MSSRDFTFSVDEYYHCYNRGTDKRLIFESTNDHQRFIKLLYCLNATVPIQLSNYRGKALTQIVQLPRDDTLVDVVAYALMPNHYHLLLRERGEKGISRFMQRLGTAYTMYFNVSRERSGSLFQGKFQAKHIADDEYLQQVIRYVHLNPLKIQFPDWQETNYPLSDLRSFLESYAYSSYPDLHYNRVERHLLSPLLFDISNESQNFKEMIAQYRQENLR